MTKSKKQSSRLFGFLTSLILFGFKQIFDVADLIALEIKVAKNHVVTMFFLLILMMLLLGSTWLTCLTLLFFGIKTLFQLKDWINVLILLGVNLLFLLLCYCCFTNIKHHFFLPATKRKLAQFNIFKRR